MDEWDQNLHGLVLTNFGGGNFFKFFIHGPHLKSDIGTTDQTYIILRLYILICLFHFIHFNNIIVNKIKIMIWFSIKSCTLMI